LLRNSWRARGWLTALLLIPAGLAASPGFGLARQAGRKPPKSSPKNPTTAPAPAPRPPEPPPPAPHIQRLVFSPYIYSYQADTRRFVPGMGALPVQGVRNPDGSSALTDHPWGGIGPWFSYDRTQWHKDQLSVLRTTGVDVILPVFRGDTAARHTYAVKGLDCLAQALKELRQEQEQPFVYGREYPLVGMYFDTEAMRAQFGAAPDMQSEEARRTFYGMIREFFLHIPPEFRAAVPLPPERARAQHPIPGSQLAPGTASVIYLSSPAPLRHLDAAVLHYCSERFTKEFGTPVLWIGGSEFQSSAAGLDGIVGADSPGGAWIDIRRLAPGRDNSASGVPVDKDGSASDPAGPERPNARTPERPSLESRRLGRTYIEGWIARLRSYPDWIFLDSWNDEREGTDIAPAHEFGGQFLDLTRAGSNQFRGGVEYGVHFLGATVPAVMAPRTLYQAQVLAQNTGQRAWSGGVGLSYQWLKDGQPVGDPSPIVTSPYIAPNDLHRFSLGLIAPLNGSKPLPAGEYDLRLEMQRSLGDWFNSPADLPYIIPIRVEADTAEESRGTSSHGRTTRPEPLAAAGSAADPAGGLHPYWVASGMPALAKAGAAYTVQIRLRNDDPTPWRKADGVAVGYRWLRVTSDLHGVSTQRLERLQAMGKVELPVDVLPGAVIALQVPVRLVDDAGKPLAVWSPKESWSYQLEWDLYDGKRWASETGAPTRREAVAALPDDLGPSFVGTGLATLQPSGNTTTTKVGLRNNGPEAWSANTDRLVYHWYYFDGSEARWAGLETQLPKDVQPGETLVVPDVRIQVPDVTGPMYMTLDLKRGQNYASTGTNSRGNDLYVLPVNVIGGALLPVNLSTVYDSDGMSFDNNRSDGDLDSQGHSFPAEELPPYQWRPPLGVPRIETPVYPCGLWTRPVHDGDRVPFWYPHKGDGDKNMISCAGQRLEFPPGLRMAVHILGTAATTDGQGDATLIYQDGTTTAIPLEMSSWTEGPRHGEHVAFTCLHRHSATADEPGVRCYLYHYTLRAERGKTLVSLELPRNPAMKVVAVTLETDTRGETGPGLHLPGLLEPK
jgi:hypothetical protein